MISYAESMKKLLAIVVLGLLLSTNAYAGKIGSGELKLSKNVVKSFQRHLNPKKGRPYIFMVTEDGKNSFGWFCPYAQCASSGSFHERAKCEKYHGKKCYVFALNGSVRWKNEYTKKARGKEKRFSRKDSIETIERKLQALGFYGDSIEIKEEPKKIEKKKTKKKKETKTVKKSDQDIAEKLKELSELYKSGVLTKKEFEKAKKKLLN